MSVRDIPRSAATLRRVLSVFPDDLSLAHIKILLLVTEHGEPQMREVEYAMGKAQPTISRLVANMCKIVRSGVEGMNLVEPYEDPDNRRYKRLRLTPTGHKVMYQVSDTMKTKVVA